MSKNFWNDRIVIITGAGSGLGKQMARIILEKKARVVAISKTQESIDSLKKEFSLYSERLITIKSDVSKKDDCKMAFEFIKSNFGGADVLINNAGIGLRAEIENIEDDDLRKVFDVNFFGALYMMQEAIKLFKKKNNGMIVNICSLGTKRPVFYTGGYTSSKSALETVSKVASLELKKYGIYVLRAYPGSISTDFRKNALGSSYPQNEVRLSRISPEIAQKLFLKY